MEFVVLYVLHTEKKNVLAVKKLFELYGRCEIAKCANSKNIKCCFLCEEFPCKLFEEGFDWNLDEIPEFKEFKLGVVKWKPYSKEYIKLFKLGKEKSKK